MSSSRPLVALARKLELRGFPFRNRFVMAPLCAMYAAPDGSVTPRMVEYYRARARGGAALIIVEITFTDERGSRAFHAQLGAHSDLMIPGLNELAEAIKGEGAVAGVQLGHCGPQRVVPMPPVVSASPIPWTDGKRVPAELSPAEIEEIVADHAEAARRVVQAGFEMIELHGAHGYLINAFLSPATNTRTDAFGGSEENRLRFPLALVHAVRAALGPDRLLCFRINGDDMLPGGLGIGEYAGIAKRLARAGVDIFHASAGTYRAMERRITPMYLEGVTFAEYAKPIRGATGCPVIASGSMHDLDAAEALVRDGAADFVSLARPLFADPALPAKALAGRRAEIRPCIRCNTCVSREQGGARGLCAINPRTGHESERLQPPVRVRDVLIVGGGPSGIQAALTASEQGHRVRLLDRERELGGKLAVAAQLPFKRPLRRLLAYYEIALARAGVAVELQREAIASDIDAEILIVAEGASWQAPGPLRSADAPVMDALSALRSPERVGRSAVVIGAGVLGAETAWYLASLSRQVTLVERQPSFGPDVNLISGLVLPGELSRCGVKVLFGCDATGIEDAALTLAGESGETRLRADTIVLACGYRRRNYDPASVRAEQLFTVGEAAGQWGLLEATRSGHRVACGL